MLHTADWVVLIAALTTIILYGLYKSRTSRNLDGYFRSNRQLPWYLVLLSIMGTQASAITFLSAPGQAFTDGMRFVQYYFGLPLAMIVICVTFLPLFKKLNLFTAYEYLETRFDRKTRTFTSLLFLLSRGLSTGISIVAPSLVVSSILGWDIYWTNAIMGGLLIIYTVTGGAKAVAYTQQLQFIIIAAGMFLAGYYAVKLLPAGIGFSDALSTAGDAGRMNIITTGINKEGHYNWNDKFNLISGVIGGFFLAWSYFGTDQSQVGRYLTAKSLRESRMGLIMNGLVKVPMQFLILLTGILVFAFYNYQPGPINFNSQVTAKLESSPFREEAQQVNIAYQQKKENISRLLQASNGRNILPEEKIAMKNLYHDADSLRGAYRTLATKAGVKTADDTNYIFFSFITRHLPVGLVGLLIAMIFMASWGSIAAALNSLASATMIDFHKQYSSRTYTGEEEYRISRLYTLAWGVFCILAAQFATSLGSLIVAVNVLGSLFYGTILGIFIVAFYLKKIKGDAVFFSALLAELFVCYVYFVLHFEGFLWLNVIGALLVVILSPLMQALTRTPVKEK
jgi:solute:Na+ symporter, SSS family